MRARRGAPRGFTLIELMISLVLFGLVTAGMLSVAVTMLQGFREQEVTVQAESSARSALDFMSQGLRGLSPGVGSLNSITYNRAPCTVGGLAITLGGPAQSDSLTMVFPAGGVLTSLSAAYNTGDNSVTLTHSADQLRSGDTILVTDFLTGHVLTVSGAPAGNVVPVFVDGCGGLNMPTVPAPGYQPGSPIVRVRRALFEIRTDVLPDLVPALVMTQENGVREPIAEGVEDMQISVGIDGLNLLVFPLDGALNEVGAAAGDDEWIGNVAGETGAIPVPLTAARAIRISLVVRSLRPAQGTNQYFRPALEDATGTVATPDNFRRRVLRSIVELRNMGGSP